MNTLFRWASETDSHIPKRTGINSINKLRFRNYKNFENMLSEREEQIEKKKGVDSSSVAGSFFDMKIPESRGNERIRDSKGLGSIVDDALKRGSNYSSGPENKFISDNVKYMKNYLNNENECVNKKMEEINREIRIGIVAAEFNYDVTFAMLELAKDHADFLGAKIVKVLKVPGVFDTPLALKTLLGRSDIHGAVALGAVVEGQTAHDEIVAQHAARKIVDLSLEYGKPVGLGIAGPGMSRMEAHERVEYAKRAVEACVKMIKRLRTAGGETNTSEFGSSNSSGGGRGGYSSKSNSESEEKAFAGLREMG